MFKITNGDFKKQIYGNENYLTNWPMLDLTKTFGLSHNVDLSKVVKDGDTFKNLSFFED